MIRPKLALSLLLTVMTSNALREQKFEPIFHTAAGNEVPSDPKMTKFKETFEDTLKQKIPFTGAIEHEGEFLIADVFPGEGNSFTISLLKRVYTRKMPIETVYETGGSIVIDDDRAFVLVKKAIYPRVSALSALLNRILCRKRNKEEIIQQIDVSDLLGTTKCRQFDFNTHISLGGNNVSYLVTSNLNFYKKVSDFRELRRWILIRGMELKTEYESVARVGQNDLFGCGAGNDFQTISIGKIKEIKGEISF